ncbi:MAG: DUF4363 family protein [Clostridia bacterium]|nr:DUF4363 family protein [Clostridia bacterium]
MIRTIISIVITLALIVGVSIYDIYYVQTTFQVFHEELRTLKQKTELGDATYSDGLAVRSYWDTKKQIMHIWVPHTVLAEIDYQLDEAIGFLYVQDYVAAIPKIEVILGLSENVPNSYTLHPGNIF